MLGRRAPGEYVFRLVGGLVGDIHKLDLRGVAFTDLWAQNARVPIQTALEGARRRIAPVRLDAEAQAGPNVLGLNITLLPLSSAAGDVDRFLGIYAPASPLSRLGGLPASRLQLLTLDANALVASNGNPDEPRIRLAAVGGQRVG